jgi:hypothetical protein
MSSSISFVRLSLSHPHPYRTCLYFCVYMSTCLSDRRVALTVIRTHPSHIHIHSIIISRSYSSFLFHMGVYIAHLFASSQSCHTVAAIRESNRTVMRVILCRLHMALYDSNIHIINHHKIVRLYWYIRIYRLYERKECTEHMISSPYWWTKANRTSNTYTKKERKKKRMRWMNDGLERITFSLTTISLVVSLLRIVGP